MKSVGEVMAIGRTFKESIQKALCSLERDLCGFNSLSLEKNALVYGIRNANERRILYLAQAFRDGFSVAEVHEFSKIDPWFWSKFTR